MKSWKKQWKKELDLLSGDLNSEVKNAEICTQSVSDSNKKIPLIAKITNYLFNHKKQTAVYACSLALIAVFCFTLLFYPLPTKNNGLTLVIETNPSVLFHADGNGKVVSVSSLNADADVILCNENAVNSLIGLDLHVAINNYSSLIFKLGFINEQDAIKISGVGNQKYLQLCQTAFEDYFLGRGLKIAIINQTLSESDFINLSGYTGVESVEDLITTAKENSLFYYLRNTDANNQEQIEQIYSSVVSQEDVTQSFAQKLKNDKHKLVALLQELQELIDLNEQIEQSDDNPKPLGIKLSFWDIKTFEYVAPDLFSKDFSALLDLMQQKLDAYQTEHGTSFTSKAELLLKKLNLSTLIETIEFFSNEFLASHLDMILSFFGEVQTNTDNLTPLLETPRNHTEYAQKINGYFSVREENYYDYYNKERKPLSREEYNEFIKQIVSNYGSLENYWESLKK